MDFHINIKEFQKSWKGIDRLPAKEMDALATTFRKACDAYFAKVKEAIEGREYAKFIFTRSLSEVLRQVKVFGEQYNLQEELSFLNIQTMQLTQ